MENCEIWTVDFEGATCTYCSETLAVGQLTFHDDNVGTCRTLCATCTTHADITRLIWNLKGFIPEYMSRNNPFMLPESHGPLTRETVAHIKLAETFGIEQNAANEARIAKHEAIIAEQIKQREQTTY